MSLSRRCTFAIAFAIPVFISACATDAPARKTSAEIIPITESNLRGQASLYHEGWFVVSSTEKAFSYAKQHSIVSSGQAMSEAVASVGGHTTKFKKNLAQAGKSGMETGSKVMKGGTALTGKELAMTGGVVAAEWDFGSSNLAQAWQHFVKGNMTLAQRTEDDRQALGKVPGNWYAHLDKDFGNLNELTDHATDAMSSQIAGHWDDAFSEARAEFNAAYRKSGTRSNSVSGLGDLMVGYFQVLYSGLAKPATRTAVQGSEAAARGVTRVVFLPVAKLLVISGRTVQSTGLSLFYTTDMGIKLVSPTVEGGLLTGMSLLSYSSIPVTAAVGGGAGAVNQVAVTVAAPAAGAGQAIATGAADTGVYAAQVSYDLVGGVTKVTINQAESGIVLGYNALTALPTQMLLGAANGVIFLAYDGPRLVLATAQGEVQWSDKAGVKHSVPVQSLPVGSVTDLSALSKEPGVQVKIISDDPQVVKKVLEKLPDDLREKAKQ